MTQKQTFRHESLQDNDTIVALIDAIQKGLVKKDLFFSDDAGGITLSPKGLLGLKIHASQEGEYNQFSIKVSWVDKNARAPKKKAIKIKSSK